MRISSLPWRLRLLRQHDRRRHFHDYFVTHLPSSSLSPDRASRNPQSHHKLPRAESQPQTEKPSRSPSALQGISRDTTVVRIPLKSAKHHFGAGVSRGSRPYNEDTYRVGTIEIPAFAKRQPISLSRRPQGQGQQGAIAESKGADSASGDPQVFYFGVFDGHGGAEASEFLRDRLHDYVEDAAAQFALQSSLRPAASQTSDTNDSTLAEGKSVQNAAQLQKSLISAWRETVGGYFKRFKPEYFPAVSSEPSSPATPSSIETVLEYAFLKADLDFTTAQASKHNPSQTQSNSMDDPVLSDRPLNDTDLLFHPDRPASQNLSTRTSKAKSSALNKPIGGRDRFKGGSTASIALISTPTPTPFWHPASPSTIVAAHVGDTRILLCRTSDGRPVPLTTNHHPSTPVEATRLRRYAATFVTDSFGEERVLGLANTRAFGDVGSKRIGVSAEPEIRSVDLKAGEFSFLVLMSDGISGHLSDEEIVDVVKEARTPEQASRDLVAFAVEVNPDDADNATALVVRLGGWERRAEGGGGSIGTKEQRAWRREDAADPRSRRQ